jgi:hypothetical protein
MSRKAVALVILSYFVAALAFGTFIELQKPFSSFNLSNPVFVGRAVGGAGGVFILAGIIPLIVWAFSRFRAQSAGGPLVLWAILGVIVATLSGVGFNFDLQQKINTELNQFEITGKDRDAFIRDAKIGCMDTQRQSNLNRQVGITDQQIDVYCTCFASGLVNLITRDEMRYIVVNNKQPTSLEEKAARYAPTCRRAAFSK